MARLTTVATASQVCALVWRIRDEDKGTRRINRGERAYGSGLRDRRHRGRFGLSGHDSKEYVAILHSTVLITTAFV